MATAAQIEANRQNAQSSTGPITTEGKENAAANSTKFGLFSKRACVQPEEQQDYDDLCAGLLGQLRPVGHLEDMLAIEIVQGAWRLRRCACAERTLGCWARTGVNRDRKAREPELRPADPLVCEQFAHHQAAVDRARVQAGNSRRRAMADLAKLQTERFLRVELLPSTFPAEGLGLATVKPILAVANSKTTRQLRTPHTQTAEHLNNQLRQLKQEDEKAVEYLRQARQNEPDSPPASAPAATAAQPLTPGNSRCACHSGLKYERCCGQNAPPVLCAKAA